VIPLSTNEARKLVLVSQGIHQNDELGSGYQALVKTIERLSYVQIDTLSVVERAHHHTCWNRVKKYQPSMLNLALEQRDIFEYWSHAAAYLPMRDYRFSLPRKQAYLDGDQHWYDTDVKQMRYVKDRITCEGAMRAKDFSQTLQSIGHAWGGHKPAKMALEQLFMQGEVMVTKREGFQKVFDLTERVLPSGIDQSMPSDTEYYDHLIYGFLRANGLGTAREISYLRKGLASPIQHRCLELVEDQQLIELNVKGRHYFALATFTDALKRKLSRRKVKILSPFDNLLIQRPRMRDLFDFDYQIECYVPALKRQYGYFVLPILCGQKFIGRLDAKIDRKTKTMKVITLFLETKQYADYLPELKKTLRSFLQFNGGQRLFVDKVVMPKGGNDNKVTQDLSI